MAEMIRVPRPPICRTTEIGRISKQVEASINFSNSFVFQSRNLPGCLRRRRSNVHQPPVSRSRRTMSGTASTLDADPIDRMPSSILNIWGHSSYSRARGACYRRQLVSSPENSFRRGNLWTAVRVNVIIDMS